MLSHLPLLQAAPSQTLTKPSTSHGGSITADGSSLTGQHFSSYSTGAEVYPQAQEQYRESFPIHLPVHRKLMIFLCQKLLNLKRTLNPHRTNRK